MPTLSAGPQPRAAEPGISAVTVPTGIFAAESRAIRRMGRNMQRAGGAIVNIAASAEHAQYVEQHENGLLEFEKWQVEDLKERSKSKDFDNWASNWHTKVEAGTAELLPNITNDKAREELKKELQILSDKHEVKIWTAATNQRIEDIKQRQPLMERKYAEAYHDAAIGKEKDAVLTAYEIDLKAKEENGLLTKPFEDYMRDFTMTLAGVAIERQPQMAKEMLAEEGNISVLIDEKLIKYLDPKKDYRFLRQLAADKVRHHEAGRKNLERLAEKDLKAKQDKNNRESFVKIRRGELVDPRVIEDMMLGDNPDLTKEAGTALLTYFDKGPSKTDDPKAVREANKIIQDVGRAEIEADEGFTKLLTLSPRLKSTTMTSKTNAFSDAEDPDNAVNQFPAKKYIAAFDDAVYEEASESVDGLEYYGRGMDVLRKFARDNPQATHREWGETYLSVIGPFLADWTKWPFGREWDEISEAAFKSEAAKAKGKSREPKNVGEFEFEVSRIAQSDKKAAKEYYDRWVNKW